MLVIFSNKGILEDIMEVTKAAREGDLDKLSQLIEDGADINASYGDGSTALHHAVLW